MPSTIIREGGNKVIHEKIHLRLDSPEDGSF